MQLGGSNTEVISANCFYLLMPRTAMQKTLSSLISSTNLQHFKSRTLCIKMKYNAKKLIKRVTGETPKEDHLIFGDLWCTVSMLPFRVRFEEDRTVKHLAMMSL